jgi:nucleoside-triphosphatase THEP1
LVYLVTGRINSGKTTRMIQLQRQTGQGDGFVSVKTMDGKKVKKFDAMRMTTQQLHPLAISEDYFHHEFEPVIRFGPYVFCVQTFERIRTEMMAMVENRIYPLFLDEVGMLEIKGQGHADLITALLQSPQDLYLSIREDLIPLFVQKFNIRKYQILSA